ncbi:MAG TPA: DNA polymerase III subunit delta' C-terminal domain-containing protein, partial [Patescibacteria group bacterium]|nr:DNA polymerase III subunit delta' C-terminal domain-containing protein [Patescibacteria group bacterium]
IYDYLVEKGANRELAKELSFMAHGRPTVAMKLFTDKELLREYRQMNKEILGLLKNDVIEKFKQIEQHTKKGQDKEKIQQKLTYLTGLLRDVLLVKNYKRELLANPYLEEELSVFAEQKSTGELCRLIYGAEQAKEYIKANINSRLVLENLLLNN